MSELEHIMWVHDRERQRGEAIFDVAIGIAAVIIYAVLYVSGVL